jgi:hypothetical protein
MVFDPNERNTNNGIRHLYDYTMGILWFAIGAFFLFHKKLGYDLQLDKTLTLIFGVSSVLYGAFRTYRGYKKN